MSDTRGSNSPWLKLLQFPLVRLLLLGVPLFYCIGFSNAFIEQNKSIPLMQVISALAMVSLAFWIYVGFVRFVERRSVSELALAGMGRELGAGLAVGAGLYTACIVVLMIFGVYRIEGFNPASFMLASVATPLSSGFLEELLFRGALFRIVEEWLGSWIALLISSIVFGFVHLINPEATLEGAIFITVEAGILLAAAYMVTRRLWMSIGFHMSWNFTQSAIFSGVVSGGVAEPGLIKPLIDGPQLLTGGAFGVESSLIAFLFCTAAGVFLLVKAKQKGQFVKPFWVREA